MRKVTRIKLAHICMAMASYCKFAAKALLPTVTVVPLPLPGWFIVDRCIIKHITFNNGKLKGLEWKSWPMPNEWSADMNQAMNQLKKIHYLT